MVVFPLEPPKFKMLHLKPFFLRPAMKALFLEVGTWPGEGRLRLAMIFMGSFLTELQGFILVITCNLTCK